MRRLCVAVFLLAMISGCSSDDGVPADDGQATVGLTSTIDLASTVGPRENHVLASAGDHLVIWGGSTIAADGERTQVNTGAFRPAGSPEWSAMSVAPIPARTQAFSFWDGSELFVLGGFGVTDGAAWDPASDTWRTLQSEVPVASVGWDTVGAWDGARYVLWHVPSDRVWAYDPGEDRWDPLGSTGIPERNLGGMHATDHGVIAVSNQPPFAAAQLNSARLPADAQEWIPMAWLSFENENGPGDPTPLATAWSDGQLFVWAASGSDSASFVWNAILDVWQEFASPTLPACEFALRPAVAPSAVVARNDCGDAALLDPRLLTWTPVTFPSLLDVVSVAHDGTVVGLNPSGELWTWTPPTP